MSRSNVKARKWMEANDYKNIFLFTHSRFSKDAHIKLEDIDVEFDGFATHDNRIVFFQIKSNCKATKQTLKDYARLDAVFDIQCLWINSVDRQGLFINNQPAETFLINNEL